MRASMKFARTVVAAWLLVVLATGLPSSGQEPEPTQEPPQETAPATADPVDPEAPEAPEDDEVAPAPTGARELLDAIREDLVALRFEKALAALEPLLTNPTLSDEERVEAMVLRSQTHAAFGDFDSAEEDYRQILLRRPGWEPDRTLTPKKGIDRFNKVRDKVIGRVRFVLDPADATLQVDGRILAEVLEPVPLTAGVHEIRAGRRGHDPIAQTVDVVAGETIDLELSLIPNARTVILRTEPEEVEVWLDGRPVGKTMREDDYLGLGQTPAQLVLEDVPLGEHTFELRKECRRTEKITRAVNIDLLDRAPLRLDIVRMVEAKVMLVPEGGPEGAEFLVDGRGVERLPADSVEACPGERELQVVYRDRVIWSERRELFEGTPQTLEIRARPNLALVGMAELPRELEALSTTVNIVARRDAAPRGDYGRTETWQRLGLDRQIDLVLAADPESRSAVARSWWVYSPILRASYRVSELEDTRRPSWTVSRWGWTVIDAGQPLVVERLAKASAGPPVGSTLVAAAGEPVADTAALSARLDQARERGAIDLEWRAPDGTTAGGKLEITTGPWLRDLGDRGVADAFRAAWAVVEAESVSPDADPALANLALMLGARGDHELALRTWRRVRWPDREGVGAGTVAYQVGKTLQRLGRDRDAVAELRKAAASRARTGWDGGPAVAPAARDRLTDLGETP